MNMCFFCGHKLLFQINRLAKIQKISFNFQTLKGLKKFLFQNLLVVLKIIFLYSPHQWITKFQQIESCLFMSKNFALIGATGYLAQSHMLDIRET